jgi:hypothetical protein
MDGLGRRRLGILLGAAGLAAALATSGCSAGGGGDASGSAAEAPAGADKQAPPGAGAGQPGQPGAKPGADLSVDQRSIVYTGSMDVRVDDVEAAATRAGSIATAAGGFVGGDKRSGSTSTAEASLQLRIPAARFAGAVEELAALGKSEHREINTQDVTEETVDLDARIATQQARVDSGRKLLGQAKSLADLVMLESEVATREADLASLQAKKRHLADLTALSTITVTLLAHEAKTADGKPKTGFLAGLRGGWKVFVGSLKILLTVLGALLPWLVAIGVPVLAVLWLLRRRRRARPVVAPAAPTAAAAAPAPYPREAPR